MLGRKLQIFNCSSTHHQEKEKQSCKNIVHFILDLINFRGIMRFLCLSKIVDFSCGFETEIFTRFLVFFRQRPQGVFDKNLQCWAGARQWGIWYSLQWN